MSIRKTTLAALCLAFVSVVAYSAAGDRFFSNPTSNKDVVIQVNKAGVTTDVMTLTGAAADVAIGAASATGTGFNLNGKGLRVHNPATALDSRANMLLTNAYAGAGGSAMGGIAWLLPSNTSADKRAAMITSDTEAGHTGSVIKSNLNFYTNNGAGVTPVGVVSSAGAWTLGPALGKVGILGTRVAGDAAVIGSPFGDGAHQIIGNGLQINFTLSEHPAQATGGMSICVLTSTDGAQSALVWAGFSASIIIISQTHAGFYVAGSPSAGQVGLTFVNTGSVLIATGGASGLVSAGLYVTCLGNAL